MRWHSLHIGWSLNKFLIPTTVKMKNDKSSHAKESFILGFNHGRGHVRISIHCRPKLCLTNINYKHLPVFISCCRNTYVLLIFSINFFIYMSKSIYLFVIISSNAKRIINNCHEYKASNKYCN